MLVVKNQYRPNRGLTRPEWSQMWSVQDHEILTKSSSSKSSNCLTSKSICLFIFVMEEKRASRSLRAVILKGSRFPTQFSAPLPPTQYHTICYNKFFIFNYI